MYSGTSLCLQRFVSCLIRSCVQQQLIPGAAGLDLTVAAQRGVHQPEEDDDADLAAQEERELQMALQASLRDSRK